jgi:HK97 family phage major capsid protein
MTRRAELEGQLYDVEAELVRLRGLPAKRRRRGWWGRVNMLGYRAGSLREQLHQMPQDPGPAPGARREPSMTQKPTMPPRDWREAQARRAAGPPLDQRGGLTTATPGYHAAWEQYLRHGENADPITRQRLQAAVQWADLVQELRADQGVGSGAAGGYAVPPGFVEKLSIGLKRSSSMYHAANVIPTASGNPTSWPTTDDTANVGAILAENVADTVLGFTFGTKALGSHVYTSKRVNCSLQLVTDAAFPFEDWLATLLSRRIGRAANPHFTNGTGAGAQPTGLVPNTATGVTFAVGSTLGYTYDGIVDLIASVDVEYLEPLEEPGDPPMGHVGFMTSKAGLAALRKVKDTAGAPVLTDGRPPMCLGYPVMVNPDMPVPAANAKSIAFGNFYAGYVVREVVDFIVIRSEELAGDKLQIVYLGFARLDGIPDDPAAVRLGVNSAT